MEELDVLLSASSKLQRLSLAATQRLMPTELTAQKQL